MTASILCELFEFLLSGTTKTISKAMPVKKNINIVVTLRPVKPNMPNEKEPKNLPNEMKTCAEGRQGGGDAANSKNIYFENKGLNVPGAYDLASHVQYNKLSLSKNVLFIPGMFKSSHRLKEAVYRKSRHFDWLRFIYECVHNKDKEEEEEEEETFALRKQIQRDYTLRSSCSIRVYGLGQVANINQSLLNLTFVCLSNACSARMAVHFSRCAGILSNFLHKQHGALSP
uniref:Uncharacterized protein n=1 Tax=Glossina austeni TaxID=7395 RepID=A0A1A9VYE5_GLOAU